MCRRWISQRLSGHRWGDERRAVMLPRSGRVGTIPTSAEEVRDRSRAAHGAFYVIQRYRFPVSYNPIGDPAGREGVNMVIRSLTVYFGIPGRTLIAYLSVSREHGTRGGISGNGYVRVDRVMIFFHDQEIARTRVTYSTQHNPGTAPDMWHHGSSAAGRRRKCW